MTSIAMRCISPVGRREKLSHAVAPAFLPPLVQHLHTHKYPHEQPPRWNASERAQGGPAHFLITTITTTSQTHIISPHLAPPAPAPLNPPSHHHKQDEEAADAEPPPPPPPRPATTPSDSPDAAAPPPPARLISPAPSSSSSSSSFLFCLLARIIGPPVDLPCTAVRWAVPPWEIRTLFLAETLRFLCGLYVDIWLLLPIGRCVLPCGRPEICSCTVRGLGGCCSGAVWARTRTFGGGYCSAG